MDLKLLKQCMQPTVYLNTKDYTWHISLVQDMNLTKSELSFLSVNQVN